jgi:uncharacterized protein with HEPN domain
MSAGPWKNLRELRNDIGHEYLIERSDRVLKEALIQSQALLETVGRLKAYIGLKHYI